jgi:hypothetical protein
VAQHLANQLRLTLTKELPHKFPDELDIGCKRQFVDYVFGDPDHPLYYFELESLDRAQLYLFLPHGGSRDESKLWYYWGTLCKKNRGDKSMLRLLCVFIDPS